MKTTTKFIIGLIILALISTTNVNAGNTHPTKFGKIFKKIITYPDFAKQKNLEGMVVVCFSLDSDGIIQVKMTSESDVTLKDYVVNKLKNLKLFANEKNKEEINKDECYYVKFVFKMECDLPI